jgi:hypothetical protein
MALWLLSLSVFCLVGWTSSGSALGCYLSVRWVPMMGWTRTNFARIWVEDEQATNSKVKSFEEDNLKPEKTTCRKLFEGPYSSRCCFTQFNTCSNCFTKIIASSTFAKITPSRSVTKIIANSCSLNRQHQEMSRPRTSSRTYYTACVGMCSSSSGMCSS